MGAHGAQHRREVRGPSGRTLRQPVRAGARATPRAPGSGLVAGCRHPFHRPAAPGQQRPGAAAWRLAGLPRRTTRSRHGRSTPPHDRDALDALPPRRDGPPHQRRHGAVARLRNTTATSAGGIVVRFEEGVPYLVVGSRRRDRGIVTWTLPKGTPNAGESREQTAIREVREETGLLVRITGPLDSIEYWFVQGGVRIHKTVHYFLMDAVGGDLSQHDHEFESVRWVSFEAAPDLLTFETERALVARAGQAIDEPPEGGVGDPAGQVAPARQGA